MGLSYQHYKPQGSALRGYRSPLDAIFLGEINLDRVRSDQWTADVITRYTLNDRWQLELGPPLHVPQHQLPEHRQGEPSRDFEGAERQRRRAGDLSLAIYYRVMAENEDWPDLVWNL